MNYLIPIIVCIAVAVISYYLGYINRPKTVTHKVTEDDIISSMKTEFVNKLHPLVQYIYKMFIDKQTISLFKQLHCNIKVYLYKEDSNNEYITIWSENELYNREFTEIPVRLLKNYDCTIKEINKQLSLADKKVLDHIVQVIKLNNKEFVNRLFLD